MLRRMKYFEMKINSDRVAKKMDDFQRSWPMFIKLSMIEVTVTLEKQCSYFFSPWLIFTRIFGVPLSQQLDFFGYINWLGNVICRILLILSLSFCSSPNCFCTLNAGIIFRRLNHGITKLVLIVYSGQNQARVSSCLMDTAFYPGDA